MILSFWFVSRRDLRSLLKILLMLQVWTGRIQKFLMLLGLIMIIGMLIILLLLILWIIWRLIMLLIVLLVDCKHLIIILTRIVKRCSAFILKLLLLLLLLLIVIYRILLNPKFFRIWWLRMVCNLLRIYYIGFSPYVGSSVVKRRVSICRLMILLLLAVIILIIIWREILIGFILWVVRMKLIWIVGWEIRILLLRLIHWVLWKVQWLLILPIIVLLLIMRMIILNWCLLCI